MKNLNIEDREKTLLNYIHALDIGDIDGVANALEAAIDDPELDRMINEVNKSFIEEAQITPRESDASLVRQLLANHLPSAFEQEQTTRTLTVADVATRLHSDHLVRTGDEHINKLLMHSDVELPTELGMGSIKQLATELGVLASDRYWRMFRDKAITLTMSHGYNERLLAAARDKIRPKKKPSQPSSDD